MLKQKITTQTLPNKTEEELLSRIERVRGQLQSAKRLTESDHALLMLELHSAVRALESVRKFVMLRDIEKIKRRFQELNDRKGVGLVNEIIDQLNQKTISV